LPDKPIGSFIRAMKLEFSPDRLREIREAVGFTRPTLGRRTRMNVRTIEGYEFGRSAPSAAALGVLAAALGCTVDDFFTWSAEDLAAARATFEDYEFSDHVQANLALAPPLSEAQLARLAVLVRRVPPEQVSA
jgi:transcriptional regulator with XRE-family HTH domain